MAGEAQTDGAQRSRQEAQQQVRHKREQVERAKLLGDLFPRWDLDHNGFIDYDEMYQVVSILQKGSSKHARKTWAKWLQTARALHRDEGFGIAEFTGLLEDLTAQMDMAEFVGFLANVNHAIEELHSTPHGKRATRIRELFLKWDFDHDGFVSFEELDVVFEAADAFREHKALRKAIRKRKLERLQEYGQFAFQLTQQEFSEFLHGILGPMDDDTFFAALDQFSRRLDIVMLARERLRRRTAGRRASLTATPAPELPEDEDDDTPVSNPLAASDPVALAGPRSPGALPPLPANARAVTVGFAGDSAKPHSQVDESNHHEEEDEEDEHAKRTHSGSLRRIDSVWKGNTPQSPRYQVVAEGTTGDTDDAGVLPGAEVADREPMVADLFYSWDMNNDYLVDPDEMALVLRRIGEQRKWQEQFSQVLLELWHAQPNTLDQGAFIDVFLEATANVEDRHFTSLVASIEGVLHDLEEEAEASEHPPVQEPPPPSPKTGSPTSAVPLLREGLPLLPISKGSAHVGFGDDVSHGNGAAKSANKVLPRTHSVWDGGCASPRWRMVSELTVDEIDDAAEEPNDPDDDFSHRESVVSDLFYSWDLNHDYLVDPEEMAVVLRRVGFQRKCREAFGEVLVKLWNMQHATLDQTEFIDAFLQATAKLKETEFSALLSTLEETLTELAEEGEPSSPQAAVQGEAAKLQAPAGGLTRTETTTSEQHFPPMHTAFSKVAFAEDADRTSSEDAGGGGDWANKPPARGRASSVWDGDSAMSPRYRVADDTVPVEEPLKSEPSMFMEDFMKRESTVADLFYLWDLDHDYQVDPNEMAWVLSRLEDQSKTVKQSLQDACSKLLTNLRAGQPATLDQTDFIDAFLEATAKVREKEFNLLMQTIEGVLNELAKELETMGKIPAADAGPMDTAQPPHTAGTPTSVLKPQGQPPSPNSAMRAKVAFAGEDVDRRSSEGGGGGAQIDANQAASRARAASVWDGDSAMSPRYRLAGEGLAVEEPSDVEHTMFAEDFTKRESAAADIFYSWDLNHDYEVDPDEMALVLRRLEEQRKTLKRSLREACGKMLTKLWAGHPATLDQTDFIDAFLEATAKVKEGEFDLLMQTIEGVLTELAKEGETANEALKTAPVEAPRTPSQLFLSACPLGDAKPVSCSTQGDTITLSRENSVWDATCAMSPRWRIVGEGLRVNETDEPADDVDGENFALREPVVADLFYSWDLNNDYVVDPSEMALVLRRIGDQRKLREAFGEVLVKLWNVQRNTMDQAQFIDTFLRATAKVKETEFSALIATLEELLGELARETEAVKAVPKSAAEATITASSPRQRALVCDLSILSPRDEDDTWVEVSGPRRAALSSLFPRWDFNKDAFLQPSEMHEVLYRLQEQRAFREVFSDFLVGLWNISHLTLDREEFLIKMTPLAAPLSDEEFSVLAAALEQVVSDVFTNRKARPIAAVEDYAGERRLRLAQKALPALNTAQSEDFLDIITQAEREPTLSRLFPKWDMDKDNKISVMELQQVLYQLQQQRAFREAFSDILVGLWTMDHALSQDAFVSMMMGLTTKVDEETFKALVFSLEQVLDSMAAQPQLRKPLVVPAPKRRSRQWLTVSEETEASEEFLHPTPDMQSRQKMAEELFSMWDFNGNGLIDPAESAAALGYLQAQHNFRESFGRFLVQMWATADQGLGREEFVQLFLQRTAYLVEEEEFLALVLPLEQALTHLTTTLAPTSPSRPESKVSPSSMRATATLKVQSPGPVVNVEERRYVISGLFPRWDVNGNGVLDPPEVVQVLRHLQQQRPFRENFGDILMALWQMETQGLDREGFISTVLQLSNQVSPSSFPTLMLGLEEALNEVAKLTNEPLRRAMWNLFIACDPLNQGVVHWPAIQRVFKDIPALKPRIALSSPSRRQVTLPQFQELLLDTVSRFGEKEAIGLLAQVQDTVQALPVSPGAEKGKGDTAEVTDGQRGTTPTMSRHEAEVRRYVVCGMFKEWDLNSSGLVEADELRHIIHTICEMRLSFPKSLLLNLLTSPEGSPLQAALEEKPFSALLLDATRQLDHDAFREFMDVARTAVDHCRAMRNGPRNTAIWQLFDLWDENKDGFIYFRELVSAVGNLEHSGVTSDGIQAFSMSWRKHFDEFQRQKEHTLSLNQFHRFLDAVYKDLPDEQFISVVRELRNITRAALEAERSAPEEAVAAVEVQATGPPSPPSPLSLLSPRTTDTIHELLASRGTRSFKRSAADAVHAALLFNVRHALDGIAEADVSRVLVVAAGDKPALFTVCAVLCLLLRYYKVDAALEVEECVGLVQQQMRTQGQLLHDVLYFDVQKTQRPVVEKVLELCEADPAGLVPCRLLILGKLWAALCTWVRCTLSYILHLHPKWNLEEPKWDMEPELKTPRLVGELPLLPDANPPQGAAALAILNQGMTPQYSSGRFSPNTTLPPVEVRGSKTGMKGRPLNSSRGDYAVGLPTISSLSNGLRTVHIGHSYGDDEFMFTEAEIQGAFETYDKDGKGWIWKQEFRELYAKLDFLGRNEPARLDPLLKRFGTVDGKLTFTEFSILMLKIAQR